MKNKDDDMRKNQSVSAINEEHGECDAKKSVKEHRREANSIG